MIDYREIDESFAGHAWLAKAFAYPATEESKQMTIIENNRCTTTVFKTYDAAATIAVANAQDDDEGFYNVVRFGSGWAVEVCDGDANFQFHL
jgi:hypothetical protein